MFNPNKVFLLRPMTMKHTPFMDGPADPTGKIGKPPMAKFTYKDHRGRALPLAKKKYTWSDATKRDKEGKPEGDVIEAVLKVENVGAYNFEEYETNEFERMAIAEGWPVEQVLQMLQAAPVALEADLKAQKKSFDGWQKKQNEIDAKLNTVIANYGSLFTTYENVRMEISAMAVELPALKGTPYDRPYFVALAPVVENLAKISFPELAKDPAISAPVPISVAAPDKTPA
jgi:hypothetical protein